VEQHSEEIIAAAREISLAWGWFRVKGRSGVKRLPGARRHRLQETNRASQMRLPAARLPLGWNQSCPTRWSMSRRI